MYIYFYINCYIYNCYINCLYKHRFGMVGTKNYKIIVKSI